jgi:acyl-coenzyme A thioesterase PaaI-like protein
MTHTEFIPQSEHQGYDGIVHGGILAAVLDDAMANCLWLRGIPVVTAKMTLRYREPVRIGSSLLVYGRVIQERKKTATTEGWITLPSGIRLVEASGTFFKLPPPA